MGNIDLKRYNYFNITGNTAEVLFEYNDFNDNEQWIEEMSMCNIHATDVVTVDLYYYVELTDKATGYQESWGRDEVLGTTEYLYYLLKAVSIPIGVTLLLTREDFILENSKYKLKIKLNAADSAVDVVIKNKI